MLAGHEPVADRSRVFSILVDRGRPCIGTSPTGVVRAVGTEQDILYFQDLYTDAGGKADRDTPNSVTRIFWPWTPHNDAVVSSYVELSPEGALLSGALETAPVEYMKPMDAPQPPNPYRTLKFASMDLETYKDGNGRMVPYSVAIRHGGSHSYYDSKRELRVWYLTDYPGETPYEQATAMLLSAMKYILQKHFMGYSFFMHNLGGFDGPIIMSYLTGVTDLEIKPLYRNRMLYSIDISMPRAKMDASWGEYKRIQNEDNVVGVCRAVFKDSFKFFPYSLAKVGEAFECQVKKTEFPHDFASYENLEYKGKAPESVEWPADQEWSFRDASREYICNDVDLLYTILVRYDRVIHSDFGLDFSKYLTLPSLTMSVYRSLYLDEGVRIPILRGNIDKFVRESYRGGSAEVYIPHIKEGFYYDMNSQYPTAMKNDMPVGQPKFEIRPRLKDFFGFIKANITAPDNLRVPLLLTKIPTSDETTGDGSAGKVVAPLGS